MVKKLTSIVVIFLMIVLAACQEDDQTGSNGVADQSNQSDTEEADTDNQIDDSGESNEDASSSEEGNASENAESSNEEDMDDKSSEKESTDQDTSPVKEENYSTEEEAVNAIEGYREIEQTNVDLGSGIKGFVEGAAGHQYISWNEGNWLVEIDFPSDPQYAVDTYEDGELMAKSIVNYLEDHMLPPPDQRGTIEIRGFSDNPKTLIRWQQGTSVYEIDQKTSEPIEALQTAVDQIEN